MSMLLEAAELQAARLPPPAMTQQPLLSPAAPTPTKHALPQPLAAPSSILPVPNLAINGELLLPPGAMPQQPMQPQSLPPPLQQPQPQMPPQAMPQQAMPQQAMQQQAMQQPQMPMIMHSMPASFPHLGHYAHTIMAPMMAPNMPWGYAVGHAIELNPGTHHAPWQMLPVRSSSELATSIDTSPVPGAEQDDSHAMQQMQHVTHACVLGGAVVACAPAGCSAPADAGGGGAGGGGIDKTPKLHACRRCQRAKTACNNGRPCSRCIRLAVPCDGEMRAVKRACVTCRRSKVKCDLDDVPAGSACSRCFHLGFDCLPHVPTRKVRDTPLCSCLIPSPIIPCLLLTLFLSTRLVLRSQRERSQMDFDLLEVAEGEWHGTTEGETTKANAVPMAPAAADPATIRADGRVGWRVADGPVHGAAHGAADAFLPLRQMQQSVS